MSVETFNLRNNTMTPKHALRRYYQVFCPAMATYCITVFGAVYLIKSDTINWPLPYLIALFPGLAALTFMWAHFRYIRETDEFYRKIQTEAMMVGTAVLLAVAMTWGMISMFTNFPELPFFYAIPIFYTAYGVGCLYFTRKYKMSCMAP